MKLVPELFIMAQKIWPLLDEVWIGKKICTRFWLFPRGIKRDGLAGEKSAQWTSKYGSVVVSGYNAGSADGINESGLSASLLYLAESDYGDPNKNDDKFRISISLWLQYVLDNHGTVTEAVADLRKEPFHIIAPVMPDGSPAQLHLAITDNSGDELSLFLSM